MPAGLPTARSLSASAVRIGRLRRWSFAALGANQFRAAFLARIDDVLDLQVRREDLDRPKGKVADPALWARNDRGGKRGGPKTHASLVEGTAHLTRLRRAFGQLNFGPIPAPAR